MMMLMMMVGGHRVSIFYFYVLGLNPILTVEK